MKPTKLAIFAIIFAMAAVAYADNTWVKAKGGSWEPNVSVLTAMKAGIEGHVKDGAEKQKRQLFGWNEYMFQYLTVELNGKKYILVNAHCGKRDPRELEDFRLILDGGSCYFSLKYDPEKKRYYDLFINGMG